MWQVVPWRSVEGVRQEEGGRSWGGEGGGGEGEEEELIPAVTVSLRHRRPTRRGSGEERRGFILSDDSIKHAV